MKNVNFRIRLLDLFIYALMLVQCIMILSHFGIGEKSLLVFIFLALIGLFSLLFLMLLGNTFSIVKLINLFSLVFFCLAPWQQYSSDWVAWQSNGLVSNYSDALWIKTAIVILIGLLVFNISYLVFLLKPKKTMTFSPQNTLLTQRKRIFLVVITLFSFLFLLATKNLTGSTTLVNYSSWNSQLFNVIRFIPVASFLYLVLSYHNNKQRMIRKMSFYIILTIILIVFFPFNGNLARYILFGVYIMMLCAFITRAKSKSLFVLLLFEAFLYVFSNSRGMTNLLQILNQRFDFNHVDFDAYQIFMNMIRYTDQTSVVWGGNIISAFAFFVPRSLWVGKMENSGGIAVSYYGSWFTNVSAPLFAEFYFAFGIIGVLILSFFLGKLIEKIDSWYKSASVFKQGIRCIYVGLIIYIMRGSLLATVAYSLIYLIVWFALCNYMMPRKRKIISKKFNKSKTSICINKVN